VTERRNHLLLVALIGAALVGAMLLIVPGSPLHKEAVLGLDLQGGFEVTLEAVPPPNRPLREGDLNRSLEIIRNRVDKLGVAEPEVRKQGTNQISAALPGVDNPDRVREIIGSTAKLELYDLQTALTGPSIDAQGLQAIPTDNLYDLLASAATQSLAAKSKGGGPYYLFKEEGKGLVAGPLRTREALLATAKARAAGVTADTVPKGYKLFKVPAQTTVIICGDGAVVCPGVNELNPTHTSYYLFKFRDDPDGKLPLLERFPQMSGEDLRLQGTRQDFDTQNGQPIVLMSFTDDGADKFHQITRAEAQRGQRYFSLYGAGGEPDDFNQNFAIVLDKEIRSFPSIDFQQYPDGIGGSGGAQITGLEGLQEAKDLALVLQTGALPVTFRTLSETQISATLGEDSLRQALRAAIVGLVIVALFLLVFYRFLGLVAVIGLAIYAVLLYAMILVFNVTLTLPGFAGMILTIGVAADANIVIFERIKEEARGGKSVRAAIGAGYGKGFATIIDANAVTAITALVLFALATAGVKGFALMLLIGTAMSLVTAVLATRAMLGLLAGFRWFNSPRFMGAEGARIPKWIQHDYVGKRKIWFGVSGAVLAIAVLSLALQGLNLGIDFEGGTKVTFATPQPTEIEEVRAEAERIGHGNAQVQGVGQNVNGEYREFLVRSEALKPAELTQFRSGIERAVGAEDIGVTTVSASFGRQIAESAVYAILFSLLLVTIYISFRFQWKFALATMLALVHDVVIAVGIYSLLDREVSTATVAAILTVLGYSIYDTIIILDRVRENIPLMRRAPFPTIANVSLWETIRRSLATTFITLLPITALYLFGGETLKDFAFALLVGIGSGAYSSIFIAAPLVSMLKEREPEYAKRQAGGPETSPEDRPPDEGGPPARREPTAPRGPQPALAPAGPALASANEKRERRRQRRRARPHGRAR
jgi:SecD/SecF fusion protein